VKSAGRHGAQRIRSEDGGTLSNEAGAGILISGTARGAKARRDIAKWHGLAQNDYPGTFERNIEIVVDCGRRLKINFAMLCRRIETTSIGCRHAARLEISTFKTFQSL